VDKFCAGRDEAYDKDSFFLIILSVLSVLAGIIFRVVKIVGIIMVSGLTETQLEFIKNSLNRLNSVTLELFSIV